MNNLEFSFGGQNIGGKGNYVIQEAEGCGHYVGCNLNIHNLRKGQRFDWLDNLSCYWYQLEPHMPFQALPPVAERLPRPED